MVTDGAVAKGTIENSDPMPAAWLSRFGRTVGDQVVDAARARLARVPATGLSARVADLPLTGGGKHSFEQKEPTAPAWRAPSEWPEPRSGLEPAARTITARDLLTGSAFSLAAERASSRSTATCRA